MVLSLKATSTVVPAAVADVARKKIPLPSLLVLIFSLGSDDDMMIIFMGPIMCDQMFIHYAGTVDSEEGGRVFGGGGSKKNISSIVKQKTSMYSLINGRNNSEIVQS
jgi:hypothetical protein